MAWSPKAFVCPLALAMAGTISTMTLMAPSIAHGETKLVPSLAVSERYDSNVFFVPGGHLEDYVTNISPQVTVDHKGPLIDGTIRGGVTGEVYVKNPGLNYIALNGGMTLNLDNAVGRLVRGAGLKISDTFYFTPQPPAFVASGTGSQVSEAFVRGIQAARANSFTNAGSVSGSYALSPRVDLQATYMNQRIRFGTTFVSPTTGRFFNTTFQTVTAGPQLKVSPLDTLTLTYRYQKTDFSQGSGGGFHTHGGIMGWTRAFTPTLTANFTAGMTVIEPSNSVQYQGTASLEGKFQNTDASLSYSRGVYPSFFISGLPLLSQVVTAAVSHRFTALLAATANANYAKNESVPAGILAFESYGVTVGLNYTVSRILNAALSYTNSEYKQHFSGLSARFDRNMVMLMLTAEWN
jgi:hypothetical protein